jgi:hypothetical protein
MTAELLDVAADDELLHPAYWLVLALSWPGGNAAEALLAVAPGMIPREPAEVLGDDAFQVLAAADSYARGLAHPVVFFSDMTRALAREGMTWGEHGVDWERGLAELAEGRFPGLYLTVSERAYLVACNPETRPTREAERDRRQVRAALAEKLGEDWPPFMQGVIDAAGRGGRGMTEVRLP